MTMNSENLFVLTNKALLCENYTFGSVLLTHMSFNTIFPTYQFSYQHHAEFFWVLLKFSLVVIMINLNFVLCRPHKYVILHNTHRTFVNISARSR